MIRRVHRRNGKLLLLADNPEFPPQLADPKMVRILGRVVEVRFSLGD